MLVPARSRPHPASRDIVPPPLTGGARVEVCIAGCGLAGLIAGYLLARERRPVMVLDEAFAPETSSAGEIARGLGAAINAIEAIVRREHIACDFERLDGYCLPSPGGGPPIEQAIAEAARAGISLERVEAPPIEGTFASPCVRWPSQALLHPGKLAAGLARAIAHEVGRIHRGIHAQGIEAGRVTSVLTSTGHRIEADVVVRPEDAPRPAAAASVPSIGLRAPRGAITRALYWDPAGRRCAWLRAQGMRGADVLMVAGTCNGAVDETTHDALEAWARMHFRCAREVLLRGSSQAARMPERFRLVGRDASEDAVHVGDGDWGTPVTRAAVAGMIIKDLVEGGRAPWAAASLPPAARALA